MDFNGHNFIFDEMHGLFLNIITPCTRMMNLGVMYESINIPESNYRWLVVVDGVKPHMPHDVPPTAEVHYFKDKRSKWGNAQRNFALDLIKKEHPGYVYFLDDDTTLHPELYGAICDLKNDFIQFDQAWISGKKRLGGRISVGHVDSGNVVISRQLISCKRWVQDKRYADGLFIMECSAEAKNKIYIPKVLSIYNTLR